MWVFTRFADQQADDRPEIFFVILQGMPNLGTPSFEGSKKPHYLGIVKAGGVHRGLDRLKREPPL